MEQLKKAQDQFREAVRIYKAAQPKHTGMMLCVCRKRVPIPYMHRCYHCGIYFCPDCAKEHFGERSKAPYHRDETEKGVRQPDW